MAYVNFHCHSSFSDGHLPPEQLARRLAQSGVRFAALTDHDTVEGQAPFKAACAREGIGFVPGLEMSAQTTFGEVHLLAYGFDPEHEQLKGLLASVARKDRSAIAEGTPWGRSVHRAKPADEVIRIVHQAGGTVFLAHPLDQARDFERLNALVRELRAHGLDGLEAFYAPYGVEDIASLAALAERSGLLVSAGTDYHGPGIARLSALGVEMPHEDWGKFRKRLFGVTSNGSTMPPPATSSGRKRTPRLAWAGFSLRIVLPTLVALALLVVPVFTYLVPAFEEALLARKREMIQELTSSAWSILAEYHDEERAGRLTRVEAQQAAIARVKYLRYGREGKDYFWITDMHPNMVMHPYRSDLDGQDVSAFTDPMGNRVFMEFLRVARERNEGYLEYLWQWKDDPGRMAPKQSYVKLFQPWGWVIGTGIYLEDVRAEIAALTNRVIHITLALAVIVALLFLFVARQSLHMERQRGAAEDALRESHEKYRALVEASKDGTMMVVGKRLVYANHTLLALLGYSADEWALLDLDDVILDHGEVPGATPWLVAAIEEGNAPEPVEAQLRRKDGATQDVLLTTERITWGDKRGLILMVKDLAAHKGYLAALDEMSKHEALVADLQTPLLSLNEPVSHFMRPLPSCDLNTSIANAAMTMTQHDGSAILVTGPAGGEGVGLVTDSDFRKRVVGRGLSTERAVLEIMSAPLTSIWSGAPGYEAIRVMRENGQRHVVVRDDTEKVVGVVRNQEIQELDRYPLALLSHSIMVARSTDELTSHRSKLPILVKALVDAGAKPQYITRAITAVADAVTRRLVTLAVDELGPAPVPFVFFALGSQGRGEQTLLTDQDNAIIYDPPPGDEGRGIHEYFVALGERTCAGMQRAGYPLCEGGRMAQNPRWCAPAARWQAYFSEWIGTAEPASLLDFNIFFDIREISGADRLAAALRQHIRTELKRTPRFFVHLAQNALHHKPLLGFFGTIMATPDDYSKEPTFNVKDAMAPIVSFARLYALHGSINAANTVERLRQLRASGALSPSSHDEILTAYNLLMALRLRHQVESMQTGLSPSNQIGTKRLTQIELTTLKQVFVQITALQKRVASDFLGGEWTQRG